jgi:hypothetical protein
VSLAPAFAQALPVLDNLPTAYSHEPRGELLYDLCAALVREGLAGPEIWRKCEDSSVAFAQRAIVENIGEERWNLLRRNVQFHLSVSGRFQPQPEAEAVDGGHGRLGSLLLSPSLGQQDHGIDVIGIPVGQDARRGGSERIGRSLDSAGNTAGSVGDGPPGA